MSAAVVAVRERPIPFTGEMVRAILDGRKTQTRRVVKARRYDPAGRDHDGQSGWCVTWPDSGWTPELIARDYPCPYGAPLDRLWVRETLRGDGQPGNRRVGIVRYAADGEMVLPCCRCVSVRCECAEPGEAPRMDMIWEWARPVLPSIHMPRWASRITLEITDVRVQRVQEISEEDAVAEGYPGDFLAAATGAKNLTARGWFREAWNFINARRGYPFDRGAWVWALTFRRIA